MGALTELLRDFNEKCVVHGRIQVLPVYHPRLKFALPDETTEAGKRLRAEVFNGAAVLIGAALAVHKVDGEIPTVLEAGVVVLSLSQWTEFLRAAALDERRNNES